MGTFYTQKGEEVVCDLIDGTSGVHLDATNAKIHWGTGTGHSKASTALITPGSEARVVAAVSQPAADKIQWVGTLTADASKTITEAGLFDAAAAGNMPVVGDFAGVALALGDKIEFTVSLEQT